MKKILVLMVCVLTSLSLFANGSKEKGSQSNAPKTLEILLSDDSLEGGAMKTIVDKWNNTHDEFKMKIWFQKFGIINQKKPRRTC